MNFVVFQVLSFWPWKSRSRFTNIEWKNSKNTQRSTDWKSVIARLDLTSDVICSRDENKTKTRYNILQNVSAAGAESLKSGQRSLSASNESSAIWLQMLIYFFYTTLQRLLHKWRHMCGNNLVIICIFLTWKCRSTQQTPTFGNALFDGKYKKI